MNAVKWKDMEAEAERSGLSTSSSSPVKRRTLSDCSNYVIPTSTILGRLSASLSAKLSLQTPNSKPKSLPEPNSNQRSDFRSKPYDSPLDKPDNHSTRSNTSVGSSNYNENAPNPGTAEQSFPKTPVRVSTANRGKENKDVFEPAIIYSRRKSAHKTKKDGTEITLPFTSPSTRKSGRIAREVTLQKTKDNARGDAVPSSCSLMEKTRAKRKEVALSPSFVSLEKQVDNSKAPSNYKRNALNPRTTDQTCPSTPLSVSTANRGKESEEVFEPATIYSRRQSAPKRKSTRIAREETTQKTKDNGMGDAGPSGSYLLEKTRAKRKEVANTKVSVVSSTNTPSQVITRTKRNATSVPLSCPPLLKTKKTRSDSSEDRGVTKSCEVPNAKHTKKRAHSLAEEKDVSKFTLPPDFIKQQNKYFQEIDDFELVEEEASEDDLE